MSEELECQHGYDSASSCPECLDNRVTQLEQEVVRLQMGAKRDRGWGGKVKGLQKQLESLMDCTNVLAATLEAVIDGTCRKDTALGVLKAYRNSKLGEQKFCVKCKDPIGYYQMYQQREEGPVHVFCSPDAGDERMGNVWCMSLFRPKEDNDG